jgi:hypothetical protein
MAKRMVVDKWTEERAYEEAKAVGPITESLRTFVLEYVKSRNKS